MEKQLAAMLGEKLDPSLKFKLLDFIDERPVQKVDNLDPTTNIISEEKVQQLVNDEIDYIICDSLFVGQDELLLHCRSEAENLAQTEDAMKEAGYGRGVEFTHDKKVRGDRFIWLTHSIDGDQQQVGIDSIKELVERLTPLRDMINPFLQEKLDDREIQLAVYGGKGEYYLRHKDAFRLDQNNIQDGQKLRKITVIAYLNPGLDQMEKQSGHLRLYLKDKIVDVTPHLGRVLMIKSELIEHEVKPTRGYQRFAITTWYRHIFRHQQKQILEESKEDESIFIGIPAYRDPELPSTIRNMIENAENKEKLHFGVCFQYHKQEDELIDNELKQIIEEYKDVCKITIDYIDYTEAKNAYYARFRVQSLLYQGEKYSLQIDSHMRMVKNWDTILLGYLQQCPNPSKSIISVYPRSYKLDDSFKIPETLEGPLVMCLKEFSKFDGLPRFSSKIIKKPECLTKPFKSNFWAAGFSFSYGRLIEECGYTDKVDDVFFGEEIYQMLQFYKQGYQLYSPPKTIIYHLWERAYRKTYKEDHGDRQKRQNDCLDYIREQLFSDEAFLDDMRINRGVDLKARTFTQFAECGGIDPSFI